MWLHGGAGAVTYGYRRGDLGLKRTRIPDFDRLVPTAGHDRLAVWRKGHRADPIAVGVGLLALHLQRGCVGAQERSAMATGEAIWGQNAPESQTLIVWSPEPDTIVLPFGEKATE